MTAQRNTVLLRRNRIQSASPSAYADMLSSLLCPSLPAKEQLVHALSSLSGVPMPPEAWEEYLLPARVSGYRTGRLDEALATGDAWYRVHAGDRFLLSFHMPEDEDFLTDPELPDGLSSSAEAVLRFLLKRGASFARFLSPLTGAKSISDALQELLKKGCIRQDSFAPVREWITGGKSSGKAAVRGRVRAMDAGRWEAVRPERIPTDEEQLNSLFDRFLIVCRETAPTGSWGMLINLLRKLEYAGKVRRGYFIEGLSGAQFVREADFKRVTYLLASPSGAFRCLIACDPCQVWGACLPHEKGRAFSRLPSTAVVLASGLPAAVFEKHGETLRVFDEALSHKAVSCFLDAWKADRIFPHLRKITVKQYPASAASVLEEAGFVREALDYVLYKA